MCRHELSSGKLIYDRETRHLVYTLVCDDCQSEINRVMGPAYKPQFTPTPPPK